MNLDRYLYGGELSVMRRLANENGGMIAAARAQIFAPDHPSNGGYVRNVLQRAVALGLAKETRIVMRRFERDWIANRPLLGEGDDDSLPAGKTLRGVCARPRWVSVTNAVCTTQGG